MKAVTLDLPENASVELLRAVDDIAWSVMEKAEAGAASAKSGSDQDKWEILAEQAQARSYEAHEKLVSALEPATLMPSSPEGDLFSFGVALSQMVEGLAQKVEFGLWSASRVGESLGNTVETALGAVMGFFVAEPKMTAQQAHDTLQSAGNVETLHAREVAAAEAVEGEAHEFRAMMAKNQEEAQNLRVSLLIGGDATAEANLGRDEYEPQRRKQSHSQSM